jgi:2-polyprenyl-6-methoxyphenol hydroxylase-like FAD-dependent oxidoreductase
MSSPKRPGPTAEHAIVIGGSIAGLLAARVLSSHFARVTVIERDSLPDDASPRKGVPQARHVHILLNRGKSILEQLFPGLFAGMGPSGTVPVDLCQDMRWLHLGILSTRAASGIISQFQSRPALEWHVRRRVKAIANVSFLERVEVVRLLREAKRNAVTGVEIRAMHANEESTSAIHGDLIIDASGRGSQTPRWLQALGYDVPKQSAVEIDFAYASRIYRRPAGFAGDWKVLICYPDPPHGKRGAYIFPIEEDCWIVTMGSRFGDRPPADEAGFMEFARSLPHPDVYEAIAGAEPLTPISTFRFPSNRRYHYEKLRRFPDRFIVLGDALCSFNPIYGQGMSVCALEAMALHRCLRRAGRGNLNGAARHFRAQAARIVEIPWMLVTTEDYRYPQTRGWRPPLADFVNWYTRKLHELTVTDAPTLHSLVGVMQMELHPLALYRPSILSKVIYATLTRRSSGLRSRTGTAERPHRAEQSPSRQA